jgi:hypothetical protein
MRRVKLVIAAMVVMVAAFAAFAGPAMASTKGVNEERGESLRQQANEENNFNPNFFTPVFNTGGTFISNGNVGFNTGFSPFFTSFSPFCNCWC